MPLFETLQSFSVHGVVNASQVNSTGASSSSVAVNAAAAPAPAKPAAPAAPAVPTSRVWKLDRIDDGKCHWEGDRQGIRKLFRRVHHTTPVDPKTGICAFPATSRAPAPAPKK